MKQESYINLNKWKLKNGEAVDAKYKNNEKWFEITNNSNDKVLYVCNQSIKITEKRKYLKIKFNCDAFNAGACLYVNGENPVPAKSEIIIEMNVGQEVHFELIVPAESYIKKANIRIEFLKEKEDYTTKCNNKADVLVVVPNYPSYENLYFLCFSNDFFY